MSRIDVTDKDPFANADAEPKDNVSSCLLYTSDAADE